MSLIGEEIVEEWMRLKGYFTIRGLKVGNHEIDMLAIRPLRDKTIDCRHIECQISFNPISWICPWTKNLQKSLEIGKNAAHERSESQLQECAQEWIEKKYHHANKIKLRHSLCQGSRWMPELVVGKVKNAREVECIRANGIEIIQFMDIVKELQNTSWAEFGGASAKHICELMKWSFLR